MKRTLFLVCFLMMLVSQFAKAQYTYTVPNVPAAVQQPSGMSCWAAVLTMLYEWKNNQQLGIDDVMNQVGDPYLSIYKNDTGLSASDKTGLINALHLKGENPASFSVQGWYDLLKNNGPLWVTTDELPNETATAIHARLLYGISTDSTTNTTTMLFIDPATATTVVEDFNDFIDKYESEVKKDYKTIFNRDWPDDYVIRIQIIHW